jgi:hypothetical protein
MMPPLRLYPCMCVCMYVCVYVCMCVCILHTLVDTNLPEEEKIRQTDTFMPIRVGHEAEAVTKMMYGHQLLIDSKILTYFISTHIKKNTY